MIEIEQALVISLQHYVFLGLLIFSIGLLIMMVKESFLIVLMGAQIMLTGVSVVAVSFGHFNNSLSGQILSFFILFTTLAQASIGFVILLTLYKSHKSHQMSELQNLKG